MSKAMDDLKASVATLATVVTSAAADITAQAAKISTAVDAEDSQGIEDAVTAINASAKALGDAMTPVHAAVAAVPDATPAADPNAKPAGAQ